MSGLISYSLLKGGFIVCEIPFRRVFNAFKFEDIFGSIYRGVFRGVYGGVFRGGL